MVFMKIMLVPGNGNADMSEIWYPWIVKEFKKLDFEVIAKNMPDADLARKEFWLPFIEQQLKEDEKSILIGHSSGAVAAMRYAETHKLEGIVLVSVCYTDLGDEKEAMSRYFNEPWQWDLIKKNVKWIVQFHSLNDPFIPIEEARFVHEKLDTEYYEYSDQGHFSSDVGKNEFPELLEALKRKIEF